MTTRHSSQPGIVLRAAEPEELAALSEIAAAAKAHWGYPRDWLERWQAGLTLTPGDLARWRVRVATGPVGAPVGFAATAAVHPRWTVEHLWVHPKAMRVGIGRLLLRDALRMAHAAGVVGLEIDADPHAAGFYMHCGGRRVGEMAAPMPGAPDRTLPRIWLDVEAT